MYTSHIFGDEYSKVWLELKLYSFLAKNNNYVEKWQDKMKELWTPRGGKLWEGKYMKKLVVDECSIVPFVM